MNDKLSVTITYQARGKDQGLMFEICTSNPRTENKTRKININKKISANHARQTAKDHRRVKHAK